MNKSIAGSGEILAGEYESIRISGSGRLCGLVRCESFSAGGSSTRESIECRNVFKVSGESTFTKDVSAGLLNAESITIKDNGTRLVVSAVVRSSNAEAASRRTSSRFP